MLTEAVHGPPVNVQMVRQKSLLANLVFTALTNSVDMEGDLPDELTAEFTARIEIEGQPPIVLKDTFSGMSGGRAPLTLYGQVGTVVNLLVNNPYKEMKIKRIECDTVIHRVYPFAGAFRDAAGRGGTDLRPVVEPKFLEEITKLRPGDAWFARLRDAYLEPWGGDLVDVFELAYRVGSFARAIAYINTRVAVPERERPEFDTDFSVVLRRAIAQMEP